MCALAGDELSTVASPTAACLAMRHVGPPGVLESSLRRALRFEHENSNTSLFANLAAAVFFVGGQPRRVLLIASKSAPVLVVFVLALVSTLPRDVRTSVCVRQVVVAETMLDVVYAMSWYELVLCAAPWTTCGVYVRVVVGRAEEV